MIVQRSELSLNGVQVEENGNNKDGPCNSKILLSRLLANASTPSFHDLYASGLKGPNTTPRKTHKCCVYIANKSNYCVRLNSIQAFCDINRDVRPPAKSFFFPFFFLCHLLLLKPFCLLRKCICLIYAVNISGYW